MHAQLIDPLFESVDAPAALYTVNEFAVVLIPVIRHVPLIVPDEFAAPDNVTYCPIIPAFNVDVTTAYFPEPVDPVYELLNVTVDDVTAVTVYVVPGCGLNTICSPGVTMPTHELDVVTDVDPDRVTVPGSANRYDAATLDCVVPVKFVANVSVFVFEIAAELKYNVEG